MPDYGVAAALLRASPTVFIPGPFARSVCGTWLRLQGCKHERRRRRESIDMQTVAQPAEPIVRPQARSPIRIALRASGMTSGTAPAIGEIA